MGHILEHPCAVIDFCTNSHAPGAPPSMKMQYGPFRAIEGHFQENPSHTSNKQEIVEKLWKCKKGSSQSWQDGSAAYDDIMSSRKIGA